MARNKRFGGWLLPVAAVAVVAGVLTSGAMVWSASNAAFSGTTTNASNSWAAGTVTISDDDAGVAMYNSLTGLTPASGSLVRCIQVTYTGSVTAPVKLYAGALGGTGLGTYLNITIEKGTGATFGSSCAGFAGASTILATTTLATFASTYTSYSNGVATGWSPTGSGQTQSFRFTISVADNNSANGLSCTLPFTWEAQA
ncbi:MAG TPA: hypothetical protein VFO77_13360 [Actinoplanes sp.]|nr:hypothetical protein [Actinoplanes sp.]